MTQEELFIREHDSGRLPFKTPEGYFEGFTERLMNRIAEEQIPVEREHVQTKVIAMRPWRRLMKYAAVVAIAMIAIGGGTLLYDHMTAGDDLLATETEAFAWDDDGLEDALDYEMVNNQQIAYYLTEAY